MAPVLFEPVVASVAEFIDWTLTIVSIMIIWYVVKFFMVAPPTKEEKKKKEEEWEQRGAKMREYLGGKLEDRKKREEAAKKKKEDDQKAAAETSQKRQKKDRLRPAKKTLVDAVRAADEALDLIGRAKTSADRDKIMGLFKDFNDEMQSTWGNLRSLRGTLEGDEREKINELVAEAEAIRDFVNNNLRKKLPKMSSDFLQKVQSAGIAGHIKTVRGMCHNLWKKIETLHQ